MSRSLTTIILIAVSLFVFFFGVWPRYQEYQGVRGQVKTKQTELDTRVSYFNKLKNLQQQIAVYQDQVDKVEAAFPSGDLSRASLYDLIQRLTAASGLALRSITVSDTGNSALSGMKALPIDIQLVASGSYDNGKAYLRGLKRSVRILEPVALSFGSPGEDGFSFNIKIRAYVF